MIDSVGMGESVGGVDSVGEIGGAQGAADAMGSDVKAATSAVGPGEVQAQAELTAGGDRFDQVAGLSGADREPAASPPAIKDGDWLHDPRQTTPQQADELQKILDNGNLHPVDQENIRQFLDDYRNKRDSLFPDNPNPLPRPVPPARNFDANVG